VSDKTKATQDHKLNMIRALADGGRIRITAVIGIIYGVPEDQVLRVLRQGAVSRPSSR
jgi:hypothetical protein